MSSDAVSIFLEREANAFNNALRSIFKFEKTISIDDHSFLVKSDNVLIFIDLSYLYKLDDKLDALYIEKMIYEVKSIYPDNVLFVFACAYASLSAVKKALHDNNILLCILSLRKCVGSSRSEFFRIIDSIKFTLDNDLVRLYGNSNCFELFQQKSLGFLAAEKFYDLWLKFAVRFDYDLVDRKIDEIKELLRRGVDEIKINNDLIRLLKLLGFRVSSKSNKPNYPDIIINDFHLFFEVKLNTAGIDALDQVINYYNFYGDDWRGILVAQAFSTFVLDSAESSDVSLMTFDDFFNFIRYVSLFGISEKLIKQIFHAGLIGNTISNLLNKRFQKLNMIVDLLSTGINLGKVYYKKLDDAVYKVAREIHNNSDLLNILNSMNSLPIHLFDFDNDKVIFNQFSILYAFPKLILKIVKEVAKK